MRFFEVHPDGGPQSPVTGYWVIELKDWFSVVLLRFGPGTRENFHSHAFNALTWFLTGSVTEQRLDLDSKEVTTKQWFPSFFPKFTPKNNVHKVATDHERPSWALSIRGPWDKTWVEYNFEQDKVITFTHGRKVVAEE